VLQRPEEFPPVGIPCQAPAKLLHRLLFTVD
jgi:hypothetical protein